MNVDELLKLLEEHPEAALHIRLPRGDAVPEHFHVTEVGWVQKTFIDCGGTLRENVWCALQVWTAHDVEHRIVAGKLAKILRLALPVLGAFDLAVEIEYGAEAAAHYRLSGVEATASGLLFRLAGKRTECLAPEKCGVDGRAAAAGPRELLRLTPPRC